MGFNKRFICKNGLENAANFGLDYLINYVRKPDALIIDSDDISKSVCNIIFNSHDKDEIKTQLKNIGFYEFE